MFARVLGLGVVGGCLGLLGCASDAPQSSGPSGGAAGTGGAQAGTSGAAQGGGSGSAGASAGGTAGSPEAGGSELGGAGAGAGAAGMPSSVAGAGGQAAGAGGAGGASGASGAVGAAGTAGGAGTGGAGDQPSCLPDGSGSITITFSGAVPFNETRGNDYTCLAHFSNATSMGALVLRVDNPDPNPYGVVIASMPKFEPGQLGSIPFDMLSFVVTPGGLWNDPNGSTPTTKRCTLDVSANQALAAMPSDYRVSGSITCSSALPGLPAAMTLQKLQFVTLFTPSE